MHDSSAASKLPSPHQPADELLDELDATTTQLGRLFALRHGPTMCSTVTVAQALTLRVIAEQESVKIGELAGLLGIKAPAASSLVDGLEKAGLIARESDPSDRRAWRLQLTEAGQQALVETEAAKREHMRHIVPLLSEDEIRTLIAIHRKLIAAMTARDGQ